MQCWGSYLYLKKFHYGPLEYVLRSWTNYTWKKGVTRYGNHISSR
ncbi:DUF418 domain-containing protein [Lysinibacillus fusiformis]